MITQFASQISSYASAPKPDRDMTKSGSTGDQGLTSHPKLTREAIEYTKYGPVL
jgi:hypothetical protein